MEKPQAWSFEDRCVSELSSSSSSDDGGSYDGEETSSDEKNQSYVTIQLHLHASNLPRVGFLKTLPDTSAIVTFVDDPRFTSRYSNNNATSASIALTGQQSQQIDNETKNSLAQNYNAISEKHKTEIVKKSIHPQWTQTIQFHYEYGKLQHFYIQVISHQHQSSVKKKKDTILGSALFEVSDILGKAGNTKVKRLRQGGCIFAHLQPISNSFHDDKLHDRSNHSIKSNNCEDLTTTSATTTYSGAKIRKKQLFVFQFYVLEMEFNKNRGRQRRRSRFRGPEIYIEIAKKQLTSASRAWITVYRSRPINAISTTEENENNSRRIAGVSWDPSEMDIDVLCNGDIQGCPIRIAVWRYKSSKRDYILGTCETTIQNIMNACINDNMTIEERIDLSLVILSSTRPKKGNGIGGRVEVGKIGICMANMLNEQNLHQQRLQQTHEIISQSIRNLNTNLTTTNGNSNSAATTNPVANAVPYNAIAGIPQVCVLTSSPSSSSNNNNNSNKMSSLLMDYVNKSGLLIDFVVAIDFTSSNGDPRIPGTKHYRSKTEGSLNDYEECIVEIGNAISNTYFTTTANSQKHSSSNLKDSSVWGFGAKFGTDRNNVGNVQHLFQCGQNTSVNGIDGILDAYHSVFTSGNIIMSHPTNILQVLQAAAIRARNFQQTKHSKRYCIVLVLIDDVVHDINETKRKLSVYSKVPLSVIIVGVGNNSNFQQMYVLNDNKNNCLHNVRHNVIFVESKHYQNDPNSLAQCVLKDIPNQIVQYYTSNGIHP